MCGIAGYIHLNKNEKADRSVLKKMTDCISYRGPDGEGLFIKDNIAIGHRRLSIIDIEGGSQPMLSENGNIVLSFNGEIYNYIELREELKELGHTFQTNSDTEVIIKAYKAWGTHCVKKFNGMWAFALWDALEKQLFLSRDRFGEKPLHYFFNNNTLVFGSEIKCLTAYGIDLIPRTELLQVYLTFTYIPGPDTFYRNIFKLLPGNSLLLKNGAISVKKYWDLPQVKEEDMIKDKTIVYQTFETLLKDAIKIRMRSDVPFGAFLSGGLDSSSIVCLMSHYSKKPVDTFTIGFNDKAFDESVLAKEVSKKFQTDHHTETIHPSDFKTFLNHAILHFDEPFGDSSAIPTNYVSKFAREKVKMVLTGDGGDEALSGYISYTGIKLGNKIKKIPRILRNAVCSTVKIFGSMTKGKIRYNLNKINNVFQTAELSFNERMIAKGANIDIKFIKELTSDIKNTIRVEDYLDEIMTKCVFKDDFYKLMYFNYKLSLPNDYLVKVDRMSMANSLEARLPFLDHRLVEFMATVHKDVKMQGWERKSILRKTVGKELPPIILTAPKRGFGIPLREWFKADSFSSIIDSNLKKVNQTLNRKVVSKIISDNKTGKKDNGNFIWTLLMLEKHLS
jgi:asparagine synthase (glutamine-hydrolysing)